MIEHNGWLLDIYADDQDGLVLWFLGEDEGRYCFRQSYPISFYASGPSSRLRELWRYLSASAPGVDLERSQKRDLFTGSIDVMAIRVGNPAHQPPLFQRLLRQFPDLDYYDADIPISVRYAAEHGVFPLAHCRLAVDESGFVHDIAPLESRWALDPAPLPLRVLTLEPDVNPHHAEPGFLHVRWERSANRLPLKPLRDVLILLQAKLKRYDPDVIVTNWGDTWLFPTLLDAGRRQADHPFNPNRDQRRDVVQRRENSYLTYGQVVYRGRQVHLFGRWHIDRWNGMMFGHYGLDGVFEQARVTGLPVQEVARKSPGAGITAMQMQVALRQGVLVPYHKQQAERFKTASELIRADRGGLVYQPLVGLHRHVAEIDFVSMYPSIMVHFNISPETVGAASDVTRAIPEIGIPVDQTRTGLVPRTLEPLLAKRIAIKASLATMDRRDCRYQSLKARSNALKWLLVVCFGYLGYKNARFGRIESHEAVTAYGRETLLRAKEAAEDAGFTVLHMYVDGLWVTRPGSRTPADFRSLLDDIQARTGLPIALEGVYRWIAFLPSRLDRRVPVANRYFGVFQSGLIKARGIDMRRHDTAPFIARVQAEILQCMAAVPDGRPLAACIPAVLGLLRRCMARLRAGQVPVEQLVVSQRLSRPLESYRVPSPAARAATQLKATGKELKPGQRVQFLYVLGEPGVWAWDLPASPPVKSLDVTRYTQLLARAAAAVLEPLGLNERVVHDWLAGEAYQKTFDFMSSYWRYGR